MGEVKYKPIEPVSRWLEYRLDTTLLDPPVFRCRVRPIDLFSFYEEIEAGMRWGKATIAAVIDAIVEWDLTNNGVPIPVTDQTKSEWLRPLVALPVLERGDGMLLGIAVLIDARNRENFLKN